MMPHIFLVRYCTRDFRGWSPILIGVDGIHHGIIHQHSTILGGIHERFHEVVHIWLLVMWSPRFIFAVEYKVKLDFHGVIQTMFLIFHHLHQLLLPIHIFLGHIWAAEFREPWTWTRHGMNGKFVEVDSLLLELGGDSKHSHTKIVLIFIIHGKKTNNLFHLFMGGSLAIIQPLFP